MSSRKTMTQSNNYRKTNFQRAVAKDYQNTATIARKALYLAKKNLSDVELKYADFNQTGTSLNYLTGVIFSLSTLQNGDQVEMRIGNRVQPTSISVRPDWKTIKTTVPTASWRVILFRWVSEAPTPIGTVGGGLQLLRSNSLHSFKSEQNRFQSQILYDKTFWNNNDDTQQYPNEIKVKLNKPISYADQSVLEPNRNGIYMLVISESGTAQTWNSTSRLFYRDT